MKTALITGIAGQDGSYLAEFLLEKGYEVYGLRRRASHLNTQRIDHIYHDQHHPDPRLKLHHGALTDTSNHTRMMRKVEPDEVYDLSAQSHVEVLFEAPEYTVDVDAVDTLRLLEDIRFLAPEKKTKETLGWVPERTAREMCTKMVAEDLQATVRACVGDHKPDVLILAATQDGGKIAKNTYPAKFTYDTLIMVCNVIHQAYTAGCRRLLQLGSSCIYPRAVAQQMQEDALLTDILEPTNEPYAVAKIADIKLYESFDRQCGTDYRSVMPTKLYGEDDNLHPENSYVLPAMIQRLHNAVKDGKDEVMIWGTGTPRREFLHVDDTAEASFFVLNLDRTAYDAETDKMLFQINFGTGTGLTILEVAQIIAEGVGFTGKLTRDTSKPNGTMRKLMDVSRPERRGWTARISLREGLKRTYAWYKAQLASGAVLQAK